MRGVKACSAAGLLALGSVTPWIPVFAQAAAPGLIYTCTNAAGKKLTSDRLIPECNGLEQRVLNADGSLRQRIAPTMTTEERAAAEAAEKQKQIDEAVHKAAVRADFLLLNRFANQAAHDRARAKALDDVNGALKVSEERLAKLARERKPLDDEAEFYVGKPLPTLLKSQIDANDAAVDAQRQLVQNQKIEAIRINERYDRELEHLRRLWAGAQAGSMGAIADAASAPPAKKR